MFCETGEIGSITRYGLAEVASQDSDEIYNESSFCGLALDAVNESRIAKQCLSAQWCSVEFIIRDKLAMFTECLAD